MPCWVRWFNLTFLLHVHCSSIVHFPFLLQMNSYDYEDLFEKVNYFKCRILSTFLCGCTRDFYGYPASRGSFPVCQAFAKLFTSVLSHLVGLFTPQEKPLQWAVRGYRCACTLAMWPTGLKTIFNQLNNSCNSFRLICCAKQSPCDSFSCSPASIF